MIEELGAKYAALQELLRGYGSVAVAFSGGVDSTLLAKVAHDTLGDAMIAVTARDRTVPERELARAEAWAANEGMKLVFVDYDILEIPGFDHNPKNRCYLCKHSLFEHMAEVAAEHGIARMVDGSNKDDEGDYRPGLQALAELGIGSPLRECGFTKADVRALSRELELPTWDMPAAACLSSRFAYGEMITAAKLARVELAEDFLHDLGFAQLRVRVHGSDAELARIEVDAERVGELCALREQVVARFKELGFKYVTLDLQGFRSGAMNEVL